MFMPLDGLLETILMSIFTSGILAGSVRNACENKSKSLNGQRCFPKDGKELLTHTKKVHFDLRIARSPPAK